MKITGAKAQVFFDNFNSADVVSTGSTTVGQQYFVMEKAAASTIPVPEGAFFKAPKSGTQITLKSGDRLLKLNPERFCKTSASIELGQGTVDVSDDCDPGATILDGITAFSGSLGGLFHYNDVDGSFDDATDVLINKFLDVVHDAGTGTYTVHPRDDTQIYLLILLNSGMSSGSTENWLFSPIVISGMSLTLGNTDAQGKELSFSKGVGKPILYKVPK